MTITSQHHAPSSSGVTNGSSFPQMQKARGAKKPCQKYFMTKDHKSEHTNNSLLSKPKVAYCLRSYELMVLHKYDDNYYYYYYFSCQHVRQYLSHGKAFHFQACVPPTRPNKNWGHSLLPPPQGSKNPSCDSTHLPTLRQRHTQQTTDKMPHLTLRQGNVCADVIKFHLWFNHCIRPVWTVSTNNNDMLYYSEWAVS